MAIGCCIRRAEVLNSRGMEFGHWHSALRCILMCRYLLIINKRASKKTNYGAIVPDI